MASVHNINVQGVKISGINLDSASESIHDAIEAREKGYVCVTGVHGVTEAQERPGFREILNKSFLVTPDGMPMVWMGRLAGNDDIRRVYGPDLMLKICQEGVDKGHRHFFYGGNDGVAEQLRDSLVERFPGLQIVGTYTPPFRPLNEEEDAELSAMVKETKPDIIWVGLSTPKQETFMSEYIERLDTTLMFGVGAAFDFHAGLVPQAPSWMQACGLEWFFRLLKEPKRLWKRYLRNNPLFLMRAAGQLTGLVRYRLSA